MTAIKVPPLGESIVEATVSRWLKNEGDEVSPGESLVELDTDKITVEVPAMARGILSKRLHAQGDVVKVDDVLAEIDETGAAKAAAPAAPAPAAPTAKSGVAAGPATPAGAQPSRSTVARPAPTPDGVRVSPAAARTAAEQQIDISGVQGTGRGGVVSKADVLDASGTKTPATTQPPVEARPSSEARPSTPSVAPAAAPAREAPKPTSANTAASAVPATRGVRETREVMTTRRKRIAEHLLEAQHATAHLTTFNEIDMSAVTAVRARLKERIEKEHGVKLSFMPFFIKAVCQALKAYPVANAQIDGDSIVYKHYVNMGIAVASPSGLVVPCIKDADQKGMLTIAREMGALAARARDGKLTMDDLTGGSFTITNGGVFGSLVSTPILNYPQVGILGLHKTQDRPVAIDGRVEIRPMMYVALSYDHRVIDGEQAVLFLVRVKTLMEDPASMLVD